MLANGGLSSGPQIDNFNIISLTSFQLKIATTIFRAGVWKNKRMIEKQKWKDNKTTTLNSLFTFAKYTPILISGFNPQMTVWQQLCTIFNENSKLFVRVGNENTKALMSDYKNRWTWHNFDCINCPREMWRYVWALDFQTHIKDRYH